MENQGSVNLTSTIDYDLLVYDDDDDDGGGGEKSTERATEGPNQESNLSDNMEGDINTSTPSRDIYEVQPGRNKALKLLALHILKHLPEDILREELDISSFKSNEAIPDYGPCMECDIPILTEDPPRSLVLNVCGDVIHQTCANKVDNHGALPFSCGVVYDSDPFLPFEEVANNSSESHKRSSVEDTSSRKKTRTKKGSKGMSHGSPMLKKAYR